MEGEGEEERRATDDKRQGGGWRVGSLNLDRWFCCAVLVFVDSVGQNCYLIALPKLVEFMGQLSGLGGHQRQVEATRAARASQRHKNARKHN
jgi:hypothetical protein